MKPKLDALPKFCVFENIVFGNTLLGLFETFNSKTSCDGWHVGLLNCNNDGLMLASFEFGVVTIELRC
jgi:hypothetical protein